MYLFKYGHYVCAHSYSFYKSIEDDSGAGSTVEVVDIGPTVKETAVSQMEAAIVALSRELTKLRTGRASPGILPWMSLS